MNSTNTRWMITLTFICVLLTGVWWFTGNEAGNYQLPARFRPVSENTVAKTPDSLGVVGEETDILLTRRYLRSEVTVVSGLPNAKELIGKSAEEISGLYPPEEGYVVSLGENVLQVIQTVDDWTPQDKSQYRLKQYQEWVAVYQGPGGENDTLIRVTEIVFNYLPLAIQKQIHNGECVFVTESELNDMLENLDEFS